MTWWDMLWAAFVIVLWGAAVVIIALLTLAWRERGRR
jgi:hypothetical protein